MKMYKDNETRLASSSIQADYQVAATGKRVIYFLPAAAKAASGEKIVLDVEKNYEFDENYQFSENCEFDTDG